MDEFIENAAKLCAVNGNMLQYGHQNTRIALSLAVLRLDAVSCALYPGGSSVRRITLFARNYYHEVEINYSRNINAFPKMRPEKRKKTYEKGKKV